MTTIDFPKKDCTRCGGTGHFSFNPKDGTVCYGCSGTTRMWANKRTAQLVEEWFAIIKAGKHPLTTDLRAGDRVAVEGKWTDVASVEATDQTCGYSKIGDVQTDHYYYHVTFADGTSRRTASNDRWRRQFILTPELEARKAAMVAEAIASLPKKLQRELQAAQDQVA